MNLEESTSSLWLPIALQGKRKKVLHHRHVNTYFLYDFLARMSLSIFHNGIGVSAERQMEQISERTISLRTQSPVPG